MAKTKTVKAVKDGKPAEDMRGKTPGARSTQFKCGDDNPRRQPPPPRREEDFDRLKAMKHVLVNPKTTDVTEGEKACRIWMEKNPGQFMETLDRLELETKKTVDKEAGKEVVSEEPIEQTESDAALDEQIVELIRRNLKGV